MEFNFEILTNVVETIGGRVIQVIGSYLDDLKVTGSFGQDHSTPDGVSWRQAEAFLLLIQKIMEAQSADANQQALMSPPAVFTYPPKGYRFNCYVKALDDADNPGTSIVLTPGKFNQRYQLTLFIVQDSSTQLVQAGSSGDIIGAQSEAAVAAYMARISDGIGWSFSQYTGVSGGANATKPAAAPTAASKAAAALKAAQNAYQPTPTGKATKVQQFVL